MAHPLDGKGLFLEFCDFEGRPVGGQLNFARQFKKSFGTSFAYMGYALAVERVGEWNKRGAEQCEVFAVSNVPEWGIGRVVPLRLRAIVSFLRHLRELRRIRFGMVFVQSPEALLCSKWLRRAGTTYRFAGTNNPVRHSRFRGWSWMGVLYERAMKVLLRDVEVLLVTAERSEVERLDVWLRGSKARGNRAVVWFPTRVDTDLFVRRDVRVGPKTPRLIYVGRLNEGKGWRLMLDAFVLFRRKYTDASLTVVGDGEDRGAVQEYTQRNHLDSCVHLTGALCDKGVATALACSNIFVFPSYREGWPTAVLEAVAVGLVPVTADVSGCSDIFESPTQGSIVRERTAEAFSAAMEDAWRLLQAAQFVPADVSRYASANLRRDLECIWRDAGSANIANWRERL